MHDATHEHLEKILSPVAAGSVRLRPDSSAESADKCNQDFQSTFRDVLKRLGVSDLNRIQQMALEHGILQGANLMVVAPSGSGKTLIGLMAALRLLVKGEDNRKAVFLVPLKALALQQYNWLRLALGDKQIKVAIDTGDFSLRIDRGEFPTHQILVMTYERFDSYIRSRAWWLKRVRLVVIDEINYLAERGRGPRLEATIIRLKENIPCAQLITLCPPIRNPVEIADWLGCKLLLWDERPVPLHLDALLTKDKKKSVVELSQRIISQGGSVIVFTPSRSKASQIALYLLKPLQGFLTEKERTNAKSLSLMLLKSNDEILSITKKLASLVEGGVAFHHAGLRIEDRKIIEEGFKAGSIRVVACTTTLGTGINTPARMVIITDTSYVDIESSEASSRRPFLRRIEPDRLHQMLGRAGRPGYDRTGFGVILADTSAEYEFIRKTYFKNSIGQSKHGQVESRLPIIESKMNYESVMLEQLLVRISECGECGSEELFHFLSKTLWWKSRAPENLDLTPMLRANSFNVQGLLDLLLTLTKHQDQYRRFQGSINSVCRTIREKRDQEKQVAPITVKIVSFSKDRIEAKTKEVGDVWVTCSFSFKNGPKCDCFKRRLGGSWSEWSERTRLCNHLIKVARYLLSVQATKPYAEEVIVRSLSRALPLDRLIDTGLVTTVAEKYRCTELGHIAASMYLYPLTVLFIKNAFRKLKTSDELELEPMINIALRALIVESGERPQLMNQSAVKSALREWIDEEPEERIIGSKSISPGDFYELTVEVGRMASAASITARFLGLAKLSKQFSVLSKRIRFGVNEDLIPLMDLSIPSLGRSLVRKLYDLGYTDVKELFRAPKEELQALVKLPESKVNVIKEYVERLATGT
jgi:replicative superfamily II helicase